MDTKPQWEQVYSTKNSDQVSWFQAFPAISLQLIEQTGINESAQVIDIGGGASKLVDNLLLKNFKHLSVLDISAAALKVTQQRLGAKASLVNWLQSDITTAQLPADYYDLWHDRAVFHFLTEASDRQKYKQNLLKSLKAGGFLIMATFGLQAPLRCSGLEIVRYSVESLCQEFENSFALLHTLQEDHLTPMGTNQDFIYCCFRKL